MVDFYESFHTYTLHYITFLLTAVVETTVFQKKMNLFSQVVVETTAFQKKMNLSRRFWVQFDSTVVAAVAVAVAVAAAVVAVVPLQQDYY
jgi:hypothetical protein